MCAIFGYLDYKGITGNDRLEKLIRNLSIEAEVRGTDAAGISYVKNGEMVTFKKPKPAHKIKLYFPSNTRAVIGHTRMTTQGSEKHNYNNHPFIGSCGMEKFALAHNGVLWNDKELCRSYSLPKTQIETDSYVAVQLLEQDEHLNAENIKRMAELVEGSFVFTILRNDGTLFLVKGNNPLTLYHFPALGMYVYASTKSILDKALKKGGFICKYCEIPVSEGEILEISSNGNISRNIFERKENFRSFFNPCGWSTAAYTDSYEDYEPSGMFLKYCGMFGVSEEDVRLLLDFGYDTDTIEEMLMDTAMLEEALAEIKNAYCVE